MSGPLTGLRVLDLCRGIAGAHTTKLLGDFGAHMQMIERPFGNPLRHSGPFKDDVPHPETSIPHLWLNTNKQSVIADIATDAGRRAALDVASGCDVLVEDLTAAERARLGPALDQLRAARPSLVHCSITPFGLTGPYAGYSATDIVLQAMGGAMHATGHATREPLRLGGNYAEWHAGLAAALAVLLAVRRVEAGGRGEHIDVSIYETQLGGKDRRQLALVGHAYSGLVTRRQEGSFYLCGGVRPTQDGFVNLLGNGVRLPNTLRMIGREDLLDHPALQGPEDNYPPDLIEEIESSYLAWTLNQNMDEALAIAQSHRLLGGTIRTTADVLADQEFQARGVWDTIDHPHTGPIPYPGRPFILHGSPRPPARPARTLGADVPLSTPPAANTQRPSLGLVDNPQSPLPLVGVRVLDLTVVWAGPFASQLLGEWGAEVLRMEPLTALQPQTRGVERTRGVTKELAQRAVQRGQYASAFPDCDPLPDPWNRAPLFNASSCNKLSFTGNSATADGRETFEQMVAISDVIVENNVPETAEKLGVNYDRLRAINPGIIVVRMPGFGLTGARQQYRCWGNHLEAMAGHTIVRAYPDMTLDYAGETYACDSVAGLNAAIATLMALRHRERTGEGQLVEVAQIEAFLHLMSTELLDYAINGRIAGPAGNTHRSDAPHGVYACLENINPTSQDRPSNAWIAIHVATDEQWHDLCRVLSAADLAADPRFADKAVRLANRDALDTALTAYTRRWEKFALFHALQAAGVPAGPTTDEAEAYTCPQLAARGFFHSLHRDDIGTHHYPGPLFQFAGTPNPLRRAPCRLGEDNDYVYRNLLGLSESRRQQLAELGEIGTGYPEWMLK